MALVGPPNGVRQIKWRKHSLPPLLLLTGASLAGDGHPPRLQPYTVDGDGPFQVILPHILPAAGLFTVL